MNRKTLGVCGTLVGIGFLLCQHREEMREEHPIEEAPPTGYDMGSGVITTQVTTPNPLSFRPQFVASACTGKGSTDQIRRS
jgi:hypothetical protein